MKKILSKEQIDKIIYLYINGQSINDISTKFKISAFICKTILVKSDIQIRSFHDSMILSGKKYRKYKLNEDFFENINTEEKAYWLGFIAADGNINKNSNTLSINLKIDDKNHLQKILDNMCSDYKIKDYISQDYPQSGIHITSYKIKKDLEKNGIFPNKSFTIKPPPPFQNYELEKAFWRGYVDGDGTIHNKTSIHGITWTLAVLGTYEMLDRMSHFISENTKLPLRKVRKSGNIFVISFDGSYTPITAIKFLYKDAKIYLDRKMLLAQNAINDNQRTNGKLINITLEELNNIHKKYGKWKKVAEHKNVSISVVEKTLKKLRKNELVGA